MLVIDTIKTQTSKINMIRVIDVCLLRQETSSVCKNKEGQEIWKTPAEREREIRKEKSLIVLRFIEMCGDDHLDVIQLDVSWFIHSINNSIHLDNKTPFLLIKT